MIRMQQDAYIHKPDPLKQQGNKHLQLQLCFLDSVRLQIREPMIRLRLIDEGIGMFLYDAAVTCLRDMKVEMHSFLFSLHHLCYRGLC
ncbi:hypothetical protein L1887_15047 [Cichorium endivia]|nr:hypothetical protein L1887_15047 [Cichorium endivia]